MVEVVTSTVAVCAAQLGRGGPLIPNVIPSPCS